MATGLVSVFAAGFVAGFVAGRVVVGCGGAAASTGGAPPGSCRAKSKSSNGEIGAAATYGAIHAAGCTSKVSGGTAA